MKLFLKRLWAYVQIVTPVLFVALVIYGLSFVNIPTLLASRCGYYVEVCEKDHVCTYTIIGRNYKQVVVEVTKWNQVLGGSSRYLMSYSTVDWATKTTDYAVCSKNIVFPNK